jgi:hypothetical protein
VCDRVGMSCRRVVGGLEFRGCLHTHVRGEAIISLALTMELKVSMDWLVSQLDACMKNEFC